MEPGEEDPQGLEGGTMTDAAAAQANLGTTAVREGFEFDVGGLSAWMEAHVPGGAGPVRVEQFKGGQSNPTYKIATPVRNYVLRRKPRGALASGAHAVDREARVLMALGKTGFPVAHVYGLCTDETVIGGWFYLMEMVEGRIFWDATFPNVQHDERPAYFDAMNATIARLHMIDPVAVGLGDFGKAGNYFARQISRWTRQYRADADAGRNEDLDRLINWLPANTPADDETAVVHGDFRCDNMIFHPNEPRILAVLDWELSTLGHPLADFAYHTMMYRMPPEIVAGLKGADLAKLNIPAEPDYVASYCQRTGRQGIPDYEFYMTFNLFRLAAIFHGIKARTIRGTAASAHARERAAQFPVLARMARECMDGIILKR